MTDSSIEVIIPVFNAAATIEDAIKSVQIQPECRRIIVVDDGSNDRSREIVSAMTESDPRIVLIRRPNRGIVAALNAGLDAAEAEFVARLDADDLSASDRLPRQAAHLRGHPDVLAVSGAHQEIDAGGRPTGRVFRPEPLENLDPGALPAREPQLTQPFMMARREALVRISGYRALPVSEDSDLYWRLLERGRLANLDAIVGGYRMHSGSVSGASIGNGRLMAVCSQLSALSAVQRRAGRPDTAVTPERLGTLGGIGGNRAMADLVRVASQGLDAEAERWLRAASAAKLMELSGYRPYELEPADVRFIAAALSDPPPVDRHALRELRKMRAATAARLVRLGRLGDALALAGPALWPEVAARAGFDRLYWRKHLPA